MKLWLLALAGAPLLAQILILEPEGFQLSPGERVGVVFRASGMKAPTPEELRNATVATDSAAFNITSLRSDGELVLGSAPIRAPGTLVLHASVSRNGCVASAKALVVSANPGGGFQRRAGHKVELIPEQDPYLLKPGQTLRLTVWVDGAPHGRIDYTLRAGRQTVETRSGCSSATLTFELP
jgi:hypothetical protein